MYSSDLAYDYPRNIWSRFRRALQYINEGDFYQARRCLNGVKYHRDLTEEIQQIYFRHLETNQARSNAAQKVNIPADYLGHHSTALTPPFRQLSVSRTAPSPYPFAMALPPFAGARNDYAFLQNAATHLAREAAGSVARVHVVYTPTEDADIAAMIARVRGLIFDGQLDMTVFTGRIDHPSAAAGSLEGKGELNFIGHDVLADEAREALVHIAQTSDLVVFISGDAGLDDMVLQRALPLANVTDNAVQFFTGMAGEKVLQTPFFIAGAQAKADTRFPFREVYGLNFAVPSALLRRVGPLDTRFRSTYMAGQELAFRMYNAGCYFVPLILSNLDGFNDSRRFRKDQALYKSLCPNNWDRKEDGRFENPKVSVYIPAYNASKYIERAVESVLMQDVEDLEVCIANDGSKDATLELLEKLYHDEPRVRWVDNRNGGIGYASNQAIRMSNALYIGQLDSDDCLKPGAVRRLMEYLDDHPNVVCAYGSCERIDADGNYVMDEYSWPEFSREKMMITSIAHHFRMFRRQAWERTTYFREDIVNAVDYDIFLKLSETGAFHHIDEKLYQRRWHGENTSNVNEGFQTSNTYRVQREALQRQGLLPFWDVHVPNPDEPRRVTYKLRDDKKMMLFWPDYSRNNPYQRLLYGKLRHEMEVVAGDIDAALKVIDQIERPNDLTFHLHWLNFLLRDITDAATARKAVENFIAKLEKFVWKGGRVIWTIHNHLSHDTPFPELEKELSNRIAEIAHVLHFHSEASIDEVAQEFDLPREKIRISRHGSYVGAYPDYVPPAKAREILGIDADDDVLLFTGQLRPYKGVEQLIAVFRRILADRPSALLILAGMQHFDPLKGLVPSLSDTERARIHVVDRFIEEGELQLLFHAADMAVYPYQKILTSGSLLLALSYGTPAVIPEVGMTREVLADREAGMLYDGAKGEEALEEAVRVILARKDAGELAHLRRNARKIAEELDWPDFGGLIA